MLPLLVSHRACPMRSEVQKRSQLLRHAGSPLSLGSCNSAVVTALICACCITRHLFRLRPAVTGQRAGLRAASSPLGDSPRDCRALLGLLQKWTRFGKGETPSTCLQVRRRLSLAPLSWSWSRVSINYDNAQRRFDRRCAAGQTLAPAQQTPRAAACPAATANLPSAFLSTMSPIAVLSVPETSLRDNKHKRKPETELEGAPAPTRSYADALQRRPEAGGPMRGVV